ncbi:MAG: hypothetical protein AB1Z66_01865 [Candidatus Limnocylindrales bacterium]
MAVIFIVAAFFKLSGRRAWRWRSIVGVTAAAGAILLVVGFTFRYPAYQQDYGDWPSSSDQAVVERSTARPSRVASRPVRTTYRSTTRPTPSPRATPTPRPTDKPLSRKEARKLVARFCDLSERTAEAEADYKVASRAFRAVMGPNHSMAAFDAALDRDSKAFDRMWDLRWKRDKARAALLKADLAVNGKDARKLCATSR